MISINLLRKWESDGEKLIRGVEQINIQLNPELFHLGLMNKKIEKRHEHLFQYIVTVLWQDY